MQANLSEHVFGTDTLVFDRTKDHFTMICREWIFTEDGRLSIGNDNACSDLEFLTAAYIMPTHWSWVDTNPLKLTAEQIQRSYSVHRSEQDHIMLIWIK
jgi:hypothetical protein